MTKVSMLNKLRVYYSVEFLKHVSQNRPHPECPERLVRIMTMLKGSQLNSAIEYIKPNSAPLASISVHSPPLCAVDH